MPEHYGTETIVNLRALREDIEGNANAKTNRNSLNNSLYNSVYNSFYNNLYNSSILWRLHFRVNKDKSLYTAIKQLVALRVWLFE